MRQSKCAFVFLALSTIGVRAQDADSLFRAVHQTPDKDGIYYAGPEVLRPVHGQSTVSVPYPATV